MLSMEVKRRSAQPSNESWLVSAFPFTLTEGTTLGATKADTEVDVTEGLV